MTKHASSVLYKSGTFESERTKRTSISAPVLKFLRIRAMAEQGDEKIALKTTPEFSAYSPGKIETCWATVTMTAPFYEPTNRAEIDLVAVIDRSGSMSGSKINLVKKTLDFVVDQRE